MSKVIGDYSAAVSIDATAHYLLIQPGTSATAYNKINRNTLLGITGSPLGTSDTQNITNKTLDNTNTITLKDTLFTLQDDGDITKQARFQLSGITTGTTRTYTLPNASVTLASLTGTESLTNKTITSPTITGGTYDNGSITVDSISGHTTSTIVTVGGVQLNNGTIGTSGAVTSTSIAVGAVQPQALVTGTGTGWSTTTYSPTLTNLTIGNGTQVAKYIQMGKMVTVIFSFTLGSTSSVGTSPTITLPVTASAGAVGNAVGLMTFGDTGVAGYPGLFQVITTTTFSPFSFNASGTYTTFVGTTASVPLSFGNGDGFGGMLTYEAA